MKYQNTFRGDRLYPERSSRIYWQLTSLLKVFELILRNNSIDFSSLFDFGCGNKPYKELFLKASQNYTSADLAGKNEAEIIISPDGTLPILDNSFSCVLSSQVLEHVKNPKLYLQEAFVVLTNIGTLILSTYGFWAYHPYPANYWRWTSAELKIIIEEEGFNILEIFSVQCFPSISIQLSQDAILHKVPRIFRKAFIMFYQSLMEIIDKKNADKFSDNDGVFVVVAKKNK